MSSHQYELYYGQYSQPSRAILLLLKITNAAHKVIAVDLFKGDHLTPDFLKMNPFHKVPVIVDGDFVLTESPAIARYILNTKKCEDHWYPTDPKKRARVDEFLSYQHTAIRKTGIGRTFAFNELFTGIPTPTEVKEQALRELHETLSGLEGYFLKDGPFIAGNQISIADLFALSEILQAELTGTDYLAAHPKIKEWAERTKAEIQPHFDEVFRSLFDLVKAKVK